MNPDGRYARDLIQKFYSAVCGVLRKSRQPDNMPKNLLAVSILKLKVT